MSDQFEMFVPETFEDTGNAISSLESACGPTHEWQCSRETRKDWATPRAFFEMVHREFHFDLDACCSRTNATACGGHLFVEEVDALSVPWRGRVWCNPPYGREIGKWVEKAVREARIGAEVVVMLLPARTDTSWWHQYCLGAEVRFIRGRLCFDDNRRKRAPFPSALVIFRGKGRG